MSTVRTSRKVEKQVIEKFIHEQTLEGLDGFIDELYDYHDKEYLSDEESDKIYNDYKIYLNWLSCKGGGNNIKDNDFIVRNLQGIKN